MRGNCGVSFRGYKSSNMKTLKLLVVLASSRYEFLPLTFLGIYLRGSNVCPHCVVKTGFMGYEVAYSLLDGFISSSAAVDFQTILLLMFSEGVPVSLLTTSRHISKSKLCPVDVAQNKSFQSIL